MTAQLAAEVGAAREEVADAVAEAFLARHPDRVGRYGDGATTHDVAGPGHHLDFLQTAIEMDEPSVFRDYALWCRELLDARGIDEVLLAEGIETIRHELTRRVSGPAAAAVLKASSAGLDALSAARRSGWKEAGAVSPACHLYVAAAVTGRREAALAIVREAVAGADSPVDVYVDIFQNALYEVGRRWQTATVTIAEEHMATATTQFILSTLHDELRRTTRTRGVAVVTGVVGERHVVGASIVANVLDEDGWDVRFIGTDLPPDAVVSAVERTRADLLAISVTMARGVDAARELIALVRSSDGRGARVVVGGPAFRGDPDLWRAVGADGFATDARGVAEVARG